MIFLPISMSDLATRNRSFFPPERMRSTALQGTATGGEVSPGSLAAPREPASSQTFAKHPPFAEHLHSVPAWCYRQGPFLFCV